MRALLALLVLSSLRGTGVASVNDVPVPPPRPAAPVPPALPANDPPSDSIYRLRLAIDIPVLVLGVVGTSVPYAVSATIIHPSCPCDPREVNSFDRGVIGNHSDAAGVASDVTVGLALLGPVALEAFGVRTLSTAVEDLFVYGEVLAINGALVTAVKHTVRRPLPRTYEGQKDLLDNPRGYRAFYSGHTSMTFSALTAGAMNVTLRHGHHWWPWLVTGLVGTSVAVERVLGGYHFRTDVMVGALVGSAIGITVPLLHARQSKLGVRVGALPGSADAFALTVVGGL